MSDKTRSMRTESLFGTLLAGAVLLAGCADFAMEVDRIPTEMTLSPDTGLLTVGQPTKLEFVVKDQNGEVMSVPGWGPPVWEVNPPNVAEVSRDGMLMGKRGGRPEITARLAGLEQGARFRMNPDKVLLSAPAIYLVQAAQNQRGTVPLIAGRPALLRVFAVSDQINWLEPPSVRVTILQDDTVVFERLLPPRTEVLLADVIESNLDASFNAEVPGSLVQPGLRLVVELDPEGVVPLAPGSRTRYPDEGSMEVDVVEPQLFRQIFVPTIATKTPDSSVHNWTDGLNPGSPQVRLARTILPVGDMEVEVHETFTTDADLGTRGGWSQWINQIRVLFEQEGRRGYYYGVARVPQPAVGGLGYVGSPVSVGLPSANIYAHELGHNQNLSHAPCGGAGGPDPNYPYREGSIGIYGYDIAGKRLYDPGQFKDVMGYCSPDWISDYHFDRATTHRLDGDGGVDLEGGSIASGGSERGRMLVVWGFAGDGQVTLDPAFVLDGVPALPGSDGPYRVEGLNADGRTEFSLSFTPDPLEFGGGGFVFLVPYEPGWADDLDRMVLTGPEGESVLARDGVRPLAVVADPSTGRIRAIIRDWDGGPLPGEHGANVTVTRGIPAGGLRSPRIGPPEH